ncbi:MAG: YggS family pyridoxal phosphate-dependent enzyme [Myxococcota bacterium]
MSSVAEGLAQVQRRIEAACARAHRSPTSVQLVAVSKRHPPKAVRAAYEAGQRLFGENYAQELRDKAAELADLRGLRWHAIGPLQINKAKYVARSAHVFHALDRLEVAQELSKRRTGAPLDCLVEVNLGGEAQKGGVALPKVEPLVRAVQKLPHLRLVGLMCLPPLGATAEASRPYFRRLSELGRALLLPELSMGSTFDFEVAIEEGATFVRVGTAIFGERG